MWILVDRFREKMLRSGFVESALHQLPCVKRLFNVGTTPIDLPVPDLPGVHEAVKHYQRPREFFTSEYYLRTYERADWYGAPPEIKMFSKKFLTALRARGLPFYVHTCFRHPDVQRELKNMGRTRVLYGAHQRSCAVNIVSAIDHWEVPDELWYYVGTLGESIARSMSLGKETGNKEKALKIEWGGRWDFFDPAHWQLSDWRKRLSVDPDHEPERLSPYSEKMRW
jgi:hypothetical protein